MDYSVTLKKRRLAVPPESRGQPEKKRPCHGLDGSFQNGSDVSYTQLNWSSTDHQNLQKHVQPAEEICKIFALPSIDKLTFMFGLLKIYHTVGPYSARDIYSSDPPIFYINKLAEFERYCTWGKGQPATLNPCLQCLAGESGHINHITTD